MEKVEVAEAKQYIVVKLGSEQFGIDIQYVDNIVRMQKITRVPKSQVYYKGVINLRGEIVPVMSLRKKFDLEDDTYTNESRIIIIKLEAGDMVGIIVDEVREVVMLSTDNIDKVSIAGNEEKAAYLTGVGKNGDALISVLNITAVISEKEQTEKAQTA